MLVLAVVLAVVLVQGNGAGSWMELLEVAAAVKASQVSFALCSNGQLIFAWFSMLKKTANMLDS